MATRIHNGQPASTRCHENCLRPPGLMRWAISTAGTQAANMPPISNFACSRARGWSSPGMWPVQAARCREKLSTKPVADKAIKGHRKTCMEQ
ncbi:hypothetical protein CT3_14160 [Comamonas terrigena NBRC 13299]|nr:hypothetical protein CT3_14160 [Comamonas terrigena NBRC 13299]